jgi:uncharacterized protein
LQDRDGIMTGYIDKHAKHPIVWVINTHSIGELRAREGVAAAINPNFKTVNLQNSTPEAIRDFCIKELGTERFHTAPNCPDYIVASGKRSVEAVAVLKNLLGSNTFIIQTQSPKNNHDKFDLVAIPEHLLQMNEGVFPNVGTIIGVPHAVTPEKIAQGVAEWADQFSGLPKPMIAVLIGGRVSRQKGDGVEVKDFDFGPELAARMAAELNETIKCLGGSLVITTSSRTGDETTEAFINAITVPAYLHDWRMTAAQGNPYFGLLGLADAVVVTGDSMSMCCEANMSRKPVYIYSPKGENGATRFRAGHVNLHKQLYKCGVARPFEDLVANGIEQMDYEPLNTAQEIAQAAMAIRNGVRR